jgi:hypothetical protein
MVRNEPPTMYVRNLNLINYFKRRNLNFAYTGVTGHSRNSDMNFILAVFLSFNFLTPNEETNFGKRVNNLCEQREVDFKLEIIDPFNDFLNELSIEGENDGEIYLNYLNYLIENDQEHETLPNTDERYLTIKNSLIKLGIIQGKYVNYDILITLLKRTRFKDRATRNFVGIFKEIKLHDHNVSPGLIADGIIFALEGGTLDKVTYQQVTILTVAAFTVMYNNGL